jgi:hypothetical protein
MGALSPPGLATFFSHRTCSRPGAGARVHPKLAPASRVHPVRNENLVPFQGDFRPSKFAVAGPFMWYSLTHRGHVAEQFVWDKVIVQRHSQKTKAFIHAHSEEMALDGQDRNGMSFPAR